jgi:hypothetical protein
MRPDPFQAAADRALARMEAGEPLSETLRVLRDVECVGTIGVIRVVMIVGEMGLVAARVVVETASRRDFTHFLLADLRYIGVIEDLGALLLHGDRWPRGFMFHKNVLDGIDCLRAESVAPGGGMTLFWSEDRSGRHLRVELEMDAFRANVASIRADPQWAGHLAIVRDEPGLLVLRFLKVRARPA